MSLVGAERKPASCANMLRCAWYIELCGRPTWYMLQNQDSLVARRGRYVCSSSSDYFCRITNTNYRYPITVMN